jgi:hypothetical protein
MTIRQQQWRVQSEQLRETVDRVWSKRAVPEASRVIAYLERHDRLYPEGGFVKCVVDSPFRDVNLTWDLLPFESWLSALEVQDCIYYLGLFIKRLVSLDLDKTDRGEGIATDFYDSDLYLLMDRLGRFGTFSPLWGQFSEDEWEVICRCAQLIVEFDLPTEWPNCWLEGIKILGSWLRTDGALVERLVNIPPSILHSPGTLTYEDYTPEELSSLNPHAHSERWKAIGGV